MMDLDAVRYFEARIYQIGLNRCVDVPSDVVAASDQRSIPVVLSAGGKSVRTNLLSRGEGLYRVFLNSDLREATGADTGDLVGVELHLDLGPREPKIPNQLEAALSGDQWAKPAFNKLTINQRREMVNFVTEVKSGSARARRIARIMEVLKERSGR